MLVRFADVTGSWLLGAVASRLRPEHEEGRDRSGEADRQDTHRAMGPGGRWSHDPS